MYKNNNNSTLNYVCLFLFIGLLFKVTFINGYSLIFSKFLAISAFSLSFTKVQEKWIKGQLSDHYNDNSLAGQTLYQMLTKPPIY